MTFNITTGSGCISCYFILVQMIYFSIYSSKEESPPSSPSVSESEPAETQTEELTVLEQPEVTPSQPAANQAMKGKMATKQRHN